MYTHKFVYIFQYLLNHVTLLLSRPQESEEDNQDYFGESTSVERKALSNIVKPDAPLVTCDTTGQLYLC